jgi:hypothetical protein
MLLRSSSMTRALAVVAFASALGCSAGKAPGVGGETGGTGAGSGTTGNGGSAANVSNGGASGKAGSNTGKGGGGSTAGNAGSSGNGSGGGGSGDAGSSGNAGSGSGGSNGGNAGSAGGSLMAPPEALAEPQECTSNAPGPRKLWRLSAEEYEASIRAIFNDTSGGAPVGSVFSDPLVLGFSVDANALVVQGLNASQLMDSAEAVAAWAAQNNQLGQFASCTSVDASCAKKFDQGFGRRAFRTKLADDDARIAGYSALFTAEKDFSNAAQAVMAAMLQSPAFLYRSELGKESGGTYTLTPYEVATELSYLLTSSTPDETLLAAADSVAAGSLTLDAMIDQQTDRLLGSGSANAVMGFMNGWLGLDRLYTTAKDDTVFTMTAALRDAMAMEAQSLITEAFNGTGSIGTLFASDHTFLNKELADFYGIASSGLGADFKSVPLAGSGRDGGLLATGAILNGYARPDTSSPTQRGHLVRTRILCQEVSPPPPDVDTTFKPSPMTQTTRQRFEESHSLGGCYNCHKLMDWTGFGFEHYDAFGRFRDTENGLPIDDSLTLFSTPSGESPELVGLSGPGSLGEYLSESDDVQRCMLRYWTYFAYGSSSWAQDACTYDAIYQEASGNGFALKEVLKAIIHAPNFTARVKDQ